MNESMQGIDPLKNRLESEMESVDSKLYAAKFLSKFFELDITIKIFGHVVFEWHFPPTK